MNGGPELIFDVGVCNGDDSAYYLHKGYRVVGIEANPLLIPRLSQRFEAEIHDGRYQLLPVGIAESDGEASFWICDDHAEWSSFDRLIASRFGARHHSVRIPTVRFLSVLERFGTPHYCKIDIEGNDDFCLTDMKQAERPPYVSVELIRGDRQIRLLRDLGYGRFKIISQRTLRQPAKPMTELKRALSPVIRKVLTAAEVRLSRYRPDRSWTHPGGCSGPFGEDTHGEWRSAEEALEMWERIKALGDDLSEWFDIHAAQGMAD